MAPRFLIALALAVTGAFPGAAAEYFPLAVGNQWVYRVEGAPGQETVVAAIRRTEEVAGQTYFVFESAIYEGVGGQNVRLRRNDQDQLVQLRADGTEGLRADFAADGYEATAEPCAGAATVETRNAKGNLGGNSYSDGLVVRYAPAPCDGAAVVREVFVPGVGLAEREVTRNGERRVFRLTYARVGGKAVFGGPEHSFRLSLDRAIYPREFLFEARMTLENSTGLPLRLEFGSGQSFDLFLKNARGNRVYTWSATRMFAMALREETVEGERNWTANDRLNLEPGQYTMEAVLTTLGGKTYTAAVPLTVTP